MVRCVWFVVGWMLCVLGFFLIVCRLSFLDCYGLLSDVCFVACGVWFVV